jgi:hypothetical protein
MWFNPCMQSVGPIGHTTLILSLATLILIVCGSITSLIVILLTMHRVHTKRTGMHKRSIWPIEHFRIFRWPLYAEKCVDSFGNFRKSPEDVDSYISWIILQ